MSDDPTIPEQGSEEAATAADDSSPPPWGEDFNPERAWRTINHLREFEPDAKQFRRLQEDEDALREFLAQRGYEFADTDDDENLELDDDSDDEYVDPYEQRLAALEADQEADRVFREEEQNRREAEGFLDHVHELAGERDLEPWEIEQIFHQSRANGFNRRSTEDAYKAHLERMENRDKRTIESYRTSKRAPHISSVGQSAQKQPNLDNDRERQQYMQERVAALERDQ